VHEGTAHDQYSPLKIRQRSDRVCELVGVELAQDFVLSGSNNFGVVAVLRLG
jgi:hypothetical protein